MKIGSQCFCFVFVACLGGFWFVLLLFSPSKWTGHPSSPLPNCSMPYCSHKFLQYFYWPGCQVSITPWLHPCQVYGAIPHPPAECWGGGPHLEPSTPLAEMECILRCLFGVRELHENPFGTSTERDISSLRAMFAQENLALHKGSALVFLSLLLIKMFIFYHRYAIQINSQHSNLIF